MDENETDPLTPLLTLLKYKESAENVANHTEMANDKEAINLCVNLLNEENEKILKTSLDTLLLLTESSSGLEGVKSATGLTDALNGIQSRKDSVDLTIKEKTSKLLDKLKDLETLKSKKPVKVLPKKKKVLILHIHGLHLETQKELEDILTKKMKGIHSVIVDVEHQKCTVTVYEHVDAKAIASVIADNTDMEAQLISRNKHNQEILVPLIESEKTLNLDQELPPYLDEKDSPVKEKAVRSAKDIRITASEWFCTAAGFLQRTFY